jgi:hypothetical protein
MASVELALSSPPTPPQWLGADADQFALDVHNALNSKQHRERWKYTKAQPILDMLTETAVEPAWRNVPEHVNISLVTSEHSTAPAPAHITSTHISDAPEASSVLCFHKQAHLITVAGQPTAPLHIEHRGNTAPIILKLAANTQLELHETYADNTDQQQTIWVELGPGSRLIHARNSFTQAKHWQFLRVQMDKDSSYTLHNHCGGAELRRQDIQIVCAGSGAHANISSAAQIGPGKHLDQQITLEHCAPHSSSEQVFHNIAEDKAKVTFNGRIHIHKNCEQVAATLSNKNLALGENATINTKPELEIYTDDVTCAHGATVGQLDPAHVFYCASRGIAPKQTQMLLASAFLNTCTTGPLAQSAQAEFGISNEAHTDV